jgi:ketosteroid isomerase-like protein
MKADAQTEAAVMAVLDQFKQAYQEREIKPLLAVFAPDPDVVVYGTGADEKRVGLSEIQKQVERDWDQADASTFEWGWHSVSAAGPVAWVAADTFAHAMLAGQEVYIPLRFTAVLERRATGWVCVQAHISTPESGQAEGESFPAE